MVYEVGGEMFEGLSNQINEISHAYDRNLIRQEITKAMYNGKRTCQLTFNQELTDEEIQALREQNVYVNRFDKSYSFRW